MTTGKTIALTRQKFVGKVMSLLFNTLSRLVIAFLPRRKCLIFMVAVTVTSDFGAQENEICHFFHFFPFYLPWSARTGCLSLIFMLIFKPAFSLSHFTLIKRLFSSCSLSAFREVSFAYLKVLTCLPANLTPAYDLSSPAFHMMYSAKKMSFSS